MRRPLLGMAVLLMAGCASVDEAQIGALSTLADRDAGLQDAAPDAPPDAQPELDAAIVEDGETEYPDASDASDAGSLRDANEVHDGESTEHDDEEEKHDGALSTLCALEPWHCS